MTPFYNKATQGGLYAHYAKVAQAVSLPIIMYNVPSRTGLNIKAETAVKLAKEFDNVVGIKEASGDISQIAKIAKEGKGYIDIYSGNDDQVVPILSLGGIGVISVLSNVYPEDAHNMCMEYLEGDKDKAVELQLKYLDLIDALFCEVNPIPVKYAMKVLGFNVGPMRLPLTELEDVHKTYVEGEIKKLG